MPRRIYRQESKDSLTSTDSVQTTRSLKKSISEGNLNEISRVIRKTVELIEQRLDTEGVYRTVGSPARAEKCHKKMVKRKLSDLDKYAKDTHDLAVALKRFVRELPEPLIPRETFDECARTCGNAKDCRQQRELMLLKVESTAQFQTLKYLMEHLRHVAENESNKMSAADLLDIWTSVLTPQVKDQSSNPQHDKLVSTLFDVYVLQQTVDKPKMEKMHAMSSVIKEVQSRHQQRESKYDNVPDMAEPKKDCGERRGE